MVGETGRAESCHGGLMRGGTCPDCLSRAGHAAVNLMLLPLEGIFSWRWLVLVCLYDIVVVIFILFIIC